MQKWIEPITSLYQYRYGFKLLLVAIACTIFTKNVYSSNVAYIAVCSVDTTPGKATITQKKQIILSSDAPVKNEYVIDIAPLAFADEAVAKSFFNNYRDNLIDFTVDFKNQKAVMRLNHQYIIGPLWPVEKWNSYLAEKAKTITN